MGVAAVCVLGASVTTRAQQGPRVPLLEQAVAAELAQRYDVAADRLYQWILEQPRAAETPAARLRLARVLALMGEWSSALLQCQAVRDALPPANPVRQQALDFATLMARRLRGVGTPSYFAPFALVPIRGLPQTDEPNHIEATPAGGFVLSDAGEGRAYAVTGDAATVVPAGQDLATVTYLADGRTVIADKSGIAIAGAKPVLFTGTWGGKARPLKKTRSLTALSSGELLLVDKDYDGVLRCTQAGACSPWGPPGKLRTVAVGADDFVFALADNQQGVRVLDPSGKVIAAIGGGTQRYGEIADIATDRAWGLYLIDTDTRRLELVSLRADRANGLSIVSLAAALVPNDGDTSLKNPSALGVLPDGSVIIAGRGTTRVVRFP